MTSEETMENIESISYSLGFLYEQKKTENELRRQQIEKLQSIDEKLELIVKAIDLIRLGS